MMGLNDHNHNHTSYSRNEFDTLKSKKKTNVIHLISHSRLSSLCLFLQSGATTVTTAVDLFLCRNASYVLRIFLPAQTQPQKFANAGFFRRQSFVFTHMSRVKVQ